MQTQMGSKICPKCRAHNVLTANLCQCGHQFSTQFAPAVPQPGPQVYKPRRLAPELWICVAFCLCLVGGVGAWMYVDHDRKVNPSKYLPDPRPRLNSNGVASPIEASVRLYANDPKSIEFIEAGPLEATGESGTYTQLVTIRGRNGFGALVVSTTKFWVTKDEVLKRETVD